MRIDCKMEIVGSDGHHVGLVDCVVGDAIKLVTSEHDGRQPRYLDKHLVAAIEVNKIKLSVPAADVALLARATSRSE